MNNFERHKGEELYCNFSGTGGRHGLGPRDLIRDMATQTGPSPEVWVVCTARCVEVIVRISLR